MARSNLQIKVGTYTGTGVAQDIIGIGFRPNVIFLDSESTTHSAMRTNHMIGDSTAIMGAALANTTNAITEILNDGFKIGTDASVNTNAVNYHYIAIRGTVGQAHFRTGRYIGTGGEDRSYTGGALGFTPDLVITKRDGGSNAAWRTSIMSGDTAANFAGVANAANKIQSLIENGFQIGTDSEVNTSAAVYHFFAMKKYPGILAMGSYVGDGATTKTITGIGFTPDAVIVKRNGASQGLYKTSTMSGATAAQMGASAAITTGIKSLDSDGFSVGNAAGANTSAETHFWIAFKSGNFNVPITRLTA